MTNREEQGNSACDVLLAYPAERNNFFDPMPPLGLASLAAMAEQRGFRTKILDFHFYEGDFRRDLQRWKPCIIGIGGTTPTRKESFHIAQMAKEVLPTVPVIYGGVHATFTAEDTLRHIPAIDYVVQGEGEYPFTALCEKFAGIKDIDICAIPGIAFRTKDSVQCNPPQRIEDLDALPMPARDLFEHPYNLKIDFLGLDADFLMTSRGCPAMCTFCSASRMFPGGVRLRSIPFIKVELDSMLARKPIRALKIFDSTFTANRKHVLAFCAMIKPYRLLWECEIRVDTVDRELLSIMKEAGCFYVDIGMETSNERLLKSIAKNITVVQAEHVMHWCRELGIRTKVFFIFGHYSETREECDKDIDYIRRHRRDIDVFANSVGIRVYPGTSLEKRMKSSGMLAGDFSWALFVPPKRNLLLMEMGDVPILEQEQLSISRLVWISLRLDFQLTNLSPEYLLRFVSNMIRSIVRGITRPLRDLRHAVLRRMHGVLQRSV